VSKPIVRALLLSKILMLLLSMVACDGGDDAHDGSAATPGSGAGFVLDLNDVALEFPDDYAECERADTADSVTQYSVCRSDPLEGRHVNFLVIEYEFDADQPYDFAGQSVQEIANAVESDMATQNPSSEIRVDVERVDGQDGVQSTVSDASVIKAYYYYPLPDGGLLWLLSAAAPEFVSSAEHAALFAEVRNSISAR
jgi:hypothetical protein